MNTFCSEHLIIASNSNLLKQSENSPNIQKFCSYIFLADVRIEGYIREKFVQFRDWFVNHGHTGSEHDFSGLRVVNVSATFYDFNSNLR